MNTEVKEKIASLQARCTNAVLATINEAGRPLASQSPFALDSDGNFLVLVSKLAEHGRTLEQERDINIMLMEDESGLANPFARERLNYNCTVEQLTLGSAARAEGEQLLSARFGRFVDALIALPDFTMYRLTPVDGRYVAGFGAAYAIADGEIRQLGGK